MRFRCGGGIISPFLLIYVKIFHFLCKFFNFSLFCIIFLFLLNLGELYTILIDFDSLYLSYRLVYNYVVHDRSFS